MKPTMAETRRGLTVLPSTVSIAQMIPASIPTTQRPTPPARRLHSAPVYLALIHPASLLALALVLLTAPARPQQATAPAKDASSYPAFDTHPDDHLSIAADPYDTEAKEKLFRVDYLKYDILPIRIIVTNSGDRPVSLDQVRIHFVPALGDRVQASEPEDVERKVSTKDRVGSRIPIGPLSIHRGGKDSDAKIEQDFHEHEYSALAVEPHTTRAGFLFYDVSGLGKQPLKGAKLLVRRVQDANGKELFYFEIPLDKYLAEPK